MSSVRYLVLALAAAPVGVLPAQTARTRAPVVVRVPDLSWIGPVVADAQARAAASLAQAGPALAGVAPAMAQARIGLLHAEAALAATSARMGSFGSFAFAWDEMAESPPAPWAQQDPADQIYRNARQELNRGRYATAADLFASIYTKHPRSTYAGDAYYWQAYALSRRDNDESLRQALKVLDVQKQKARGASTRRDADQLRIRICGELARRGDSECAAEIAEEARQAMTATPPTPPTAVTPPTPATPPVRITRGEQRRRERCDTEDDIQSAALNSLLQMDAERALPILKKVLARRDEASLCLRRKAVFLVSQHEGPETERILLDAARTDPDGQVREQAVQWLSQVDTPAAVAALDSILRSAGDPALQDKAIFALSQQDSPRARQALRDFALRAGVSSDLRQKAIFWIGQGDDPDRVGFLKTLFTQLRDHESRDKILFSMSQVEGRESQRWLLGVAGDVNENIELRKKALFWAGQSDIPSTELFTLYEKMPSRELKEHLIFVYSQRDEKAAVDKLFEIARTETDMELRKKAIFWLGQSDDPRVPAFLERLLEGKPN
ncbi:MAG TPA: HEAT repeat domain-containing protein [Gemmatimonadales bacterium]|nr:HEAT repeat domain-containing protein [Gemmatimonadales bacterium]